MGRFNLSKTSKVKHSKTSINTQLSTRKSESKKQGLRIINEKNEPITLDQIPKKSLTYKGAFPFLMDAISELCTQNPQFPNGEYVIKGQDQRVSHFSAMLKWETLTYLATRDEPIAKSSFHREILRLYKSPPDLYISIGDGRSVLTKAFFIRSIVYTDKSKMTKKEAEQCEKLGIEKTIDYVDIEFFKPLFIDCFTGKEKAGFIYTDPAFYAKLLKTINTLRNDKRQALRWQRFYNPLTKTHIQKQPATYYKFILWLLMHISSNKKANALTLNEEQIITLLENVDPNQLQDQKGKTYLRNKYDTKLFIDKACSIYNEMGRLGFSEKTIAVSEHCFYSEINGKLKIEIKYTRETPRTSIKPYTSNYLEQLEHNKPLLIEYADETSI